MSRLRKPFDRRRFLAACASGVVGGLAFGALPWRLACAQDKAIHTKTIPTSGEAIPVIGMGTWITFNVGNNNQLRNHRLKILQAFFEAGGTVIDSSPMYGTSEAVLGYCLEQISAPTPEFSATKVWTRGAGRPQIEESLGLWGLERFDLLQVHNLVDWREHLPMLREMKDQGRVRYIGITTSHGRRHEEFEKIMRSEPLDFVQLSYNVLNRRVEQRLLPLAADKGMAVIANRPFMQKELFHKFQHHPLPAWAAEIGCANWAEYFLKFIVSHPAVTCAIPATSQLPHMHENMGALTGPLPEQPDRERMARYLQSL